MPTRGHMKSVEFRQAALAPAPANPVTDAVAPAVPAVHSASASGANAVSAVRAVAAAMRPPTKPPSPVAAAAAKSTQSSPHFTAEETILLRGLASGASSKEMAAQMRLPRESLYRLIGDLRRKTGAASDTALAVWVLRNMGTAGSERRGGVR